MDIGKIPAWVEESCIIRISPYNLVGLNRTIGTISMLFEVYCHYRINQLSNYQTRIDTISQQFLEVFNGYELGGVGKLFFDRMDELDRETNYGVTPFRGKWLTMSTHAS